MRNKNTKNKGKRKFSTRRNEHPSADGHRRMIVWRVPCLIAKARQALNAFKVKILMR